MDDAVNPVTFKTTENRKMFLPNVIMERSNEPIKFTISVPVGRSFQTGKIPETR